MAHAMRRRAFFIYFNDKDEDGDMIVYGSGGGTSVVGEAGTHECPVCKQTSTFSAVCNYRYWHIYWLCSIVTGKDYFIACDNCQNATPVDKATIKAQYPKDNIPLIRKWGWLPFAALLVFILGVGISSSMESSANRKERIATFLAEPKVNDVVDCNLSYVANSGFGPDNPNISNRKAWGTLKVVEVDGDEYFLATSTKAWEEKKGLSQNRGSIQYDMKDLVYLDKADLQELYDKGHLIEVRLAKR